MTIKIVYEDHNGTIAPLFHQYPLQNNPQRAYLDFDPASAPGFILRAGYNGEVGNAVPMNVWNRKILRFSIDAGTTETSLDALSDNEELAALLQIVCDGHEESPDKGHYNEQAEDAIRAIEDLLGDLLDRASVWDAAEWLRDSHLTTKSLADAGSVSALADAYDPDNCSDNVVMGDMDKAVAEQVADEFRRKDHEDYDRDDLRAAEILAEYDPDRYSRLLPPAAEA